MVGVMSVRRGLYSVLIAVAAVVLALIVGMGAAFAEEPTEPREDEQFDQRGIEIDVRVGARRTLIPLAVPDTLLGSDDVEEAAEEIEEILRRNLDLSGYFRVLPTDSFFFDTDAEGMSATGIDFMNWLNVGAQGLIKSSVSRRGDEYHLDLRLYAVEQGRQVQLNWEAEPVARAGIRAEVNEFINAVMEYYTGEAGIFGSLIAFSRRSEGGAKHIYTMEIDGSGMRRISNFNGINLIPRFGPPGQIYFTSFRDGNPDLFVFRNGSVEKLSGQPGQNSGAAYCGGQLAVTLARGTENTDIYLIDPQSGAIQRRLTENRHIDVSPTWSPDCRRIAFVSGRSSGAHIFVMNADGTDQRRLTFHGSYNTTPNWSPRGDRIVFAGRDEYNAYDVFTVDLDGNIERLTQDQGNNFEPSYSPDGRYILFSSDRGGSGKQLFIMTRDGQVQRPLTRGGGSYEEPVWER